MPEDVFRVVAQIMRYWFVALGLLIVWRTYRALRQERKARHRRLRRLPGAGMVGEWLVLAGSQELPEGIVVPVPWEGVLGSRRTCDVYIPVEGVTPSHLYFDFSKKKGLRLVPAYRQLCMVNDVPVTWRSVRKKPVQLRHGDVLTVGEAVLRLRIYAGLEQTLCPVFAEDEAPAGEAAANPQTPANVFEASSQVEYTGLPGYDCAQQKAQPFPPVVVQPQTPPPRPQEESVAPQVRVYPYCGEAPGAVGTGDSGNPPAADDRAKRARRRRGESS